MYTLLGSLKVKIEGKWASKTCSIDVSNGDFTSTIKLVSSGHFQLKAPRGKLVVNSLSCRDGFFSIPVHHTFESDEFTFYHNSQAQQSYAGHIVIDWQTQGPSPLLYILSLPLAYLVGGSTKTMSITVKNKFKSMLKRQPAGQSALGLAMAKSFPTIASDYLKSDSSVLALAKEKK